MDKKIIKKYAELVVKTGVNLQKGEMLVISAPVNAADLVEEIVLSAYRNGASDVEVLWNDEIVSKYGFKYKTKKQLSVIPEWEKIQRGSYVDKKVAYMAIISDDPENFKGIDPEKIAIYRRAKNTAFSKFRDYTSSNKLRWSLFAYPNKKWAKKVYPDLSATKAMKKLWQAIIDTARLSADDPVRAWEDHQNTLQSRCDKLNRAKIRKLYYKNSIGTDFSIGLPENYLFCGGAEAGVFDGVTFAANIPTEEVFSSPDRNSANGRLVAAMPLCRNGQIIENFWLEFKDGEIVDYGAEKGYDNLKSIIETDEGSHYLGEIALVGYNSPVRKQNALFYETLFDENASCHFAIGDSYPNCIKGGADMDENQIRTAGLNVSLEHVDFMVGTKDLSIKAETENGEIFDVFSDGDWAI